MVHKGCALDEPEKFKIEERAEDRTEDTVEGLEHKVNDRGNTVVPYKVIAEVVVTQVGEGTDAAESPANHKQELVVHTVGQISIHNGR